jgi:amino acid adenylation domain-containing protein
VFSTLHEWQSASESPLTVGWPVGCFCWIVDPDDPQRLAPTGCLGEVIIQGPTLLREYLSDPERTAATTVTSLPDWMPRRDSPGWKRFFRSGDLCFYNPDGTIEFASRKDTQVKIRGLRVELGEVEHHMRAAMKDVRQVVVDVIRGDTGPSLVSYFCFSDDTRTLVEANPESVFLPLTADLKNKITDSLGRLIIVLPSYMVPTIFIPCRYIPSITSTKIDREGLHRMARSLSREALAAYLLVDTEKRVPETLMESRLQKIWATTLNIPVDSIGRDDSFLRIGGDSISAIRLVAIAREAGITVTVKDIFDDPRLSVTASKAVEAGDGQKYETEPFSILHSDQVDAILSEVRTQCALSSDQAIEDAYPCTGLQEGLMALTVKQPGSYIAKYVYRLPDAVESSRFKVAWERTVEVCGNLRTRIVLRDSSSIQALIREDATWESTDGLDLRSVMNAAQSVEMGYGSRLCRFALVGSDSDSGERYFVLIIHHAVFDGWSLSLILDALQRIYHDNDLSVLHPYAGFIKYTTDLDLEAASEYWKTQLDMAQRATFPPVERTIGSNAVSRILRRTITFPRLTDTSITKATVLRAAWAIVLARYCNTDDVCFGTTVSGRNAPVTGVEGMAGPAVATVPVRVRLDRQQAVSSFLLDIQTQASEMVAYEQFGLKNINKLSPRIKEACDFTSLLVIQPVQHTLSGEITSGAVLESSSGKYGDEEAIEGYFSYPLVVQGLTYDDHVELLLQYNSTVVAESQLVMLSHHFQQVIQQLLEQDGAPLRLLSLAGPSDLQQAIHNNSEDTEIIHSCVHELIAAQAASQPTAPAICAWDHEFTYGQLDSAANRLANYLVKGTRVKTGDLVHVCFEKSAWFFVAILAINKAGAAWVPLDPSHPVQRHQEIVRQTGATLALVSANMAIKCVGLVADVIEVTPSLDQKLVVDVGPSPPPPECYVSADDAAYVLFTSGSTGTPKGLAMQHRAVCTSQTAISKRLRLTPDVRMLQFAAFVFDLCIGEIVAPLISGACLCVPSEDTRMNGLREFIRDMKVNWAFMTPAFARTLTPDDVPGLELLLLAGEAVGQDIFDTWFGRVRLINGWGPAETCVFSTLHEWHSPSESPLTVGRPVGGFCWIVDPDDPQRLAPTGCVGEVIIQGPTLLREYLSDPERTAATTMTSLPDWMPRRDSPGWKRFFRSGDLCFYNPDGTIEFVSRKDTQVKIRGLRVELGEVEHHMRAAMKGVQQVVVDVIRGDTGPSLVSYFCFSKETYTIGSGAEAADSESPFISLTPELNSEITAAVGQLSVMLPSYMVPTVFIPCKSMPFVTSTKLDRVGLRRMTASLSREAREAYSLVESEKREPSTQMESRLQEIWSVLLNVPAKSIGRDDNFLRIGGDSILAIQLVTTLREVGIELTVKDIFSDPRLSAIASKAVESGYEQSFASEPFSILPSDELDTILSEVRSQCALSIGQVIQDAYPCTSVQHEMIDFSTVEPRGFIREYVCRIPNHIDIVRFKAAWERTVDLCGNLRTRIMRHKGVSIQAVIKDDVVWDPVDGKDLRSVMKAAQEIKMGYGSRLCRYALVEDNGENYFVLILHHALFDGWSLTITLKSLHRAYFEMDLPPLPPFAGFVKFSSEVNHAAANEYWGAQLRGFTPVPLPFGQYITESSASTFKYESILMTRTISFPRSTGTSITKASLLRAAWAVLLARYCNVDDISFVTCVTGRNAPVSGLTMMAGPVIAHVPVRVRLDSNLSVSNFLQRVQEQALDMVQFEQFGLQNISRLSPVAKAACDSSWQLLVQPVEHFSLKGNSTATILNPVSPEKYEPPALIKGFQNIHLSFHAIIVEDRVDLGLFYNPHVMSESSLEVLCYQYNIIVQQLLAQDERPLSSVSLADADNLYIL